MIMLLHEHELFYLICCVAVVALFLDPDTDAPVGV